MEKPKEAFVKACYVPARYMGICLEYSETHDASKVLALDAYNRSCPPAFHRKMINNIFYSNYRKIRWKRINNKEKINWILKKLCITLYQKKII